MPNLWGFTPSDSFVCSTIIIRTCSSELRGGRGAIQPRLWSQYHDSIQQERAIATYILVPRESCHNCTKEQVIRISFEKPSKPYLRLSALEPSQSSCCSMQGSNKLSLGRNMKAPWHNYNYKNSLLFRSNKNNNSVSGNARSWTWSLDWSSFQYAPGPCADVLYDQRKFT